MNGKVRTVAWHEFVTSVRRKEFILITLILPVMILVFGGLGAVGSLMAGDAIGDRSPRTLGIVDLSGALDVARAAAASDDARAVIPFGSVEAGLQAVRGGRIASLIVVNPGYLDTGSVTLYRKRASLFSSRGATGVGRVLVRGLLSRRHVSPQVMQRAVEPVGTAGPRDLVLDAGGRFVRRDLGKEAARLAIPYGFAILLTTSIFFAASYLLRGLADEKENRVIEVILSSVTADELLLGKLIGLAGVGLTQIGIWFAIGGAPAMVLFASYIRLSPAAVLGAGLFFLLGYALYATLMAGVGALGTSQRESQQISGMISLGAFIPFVFMPVLLEYPNGALARVLSFIPFTAPTTMVLRVTATDVPPADVALSAGAIVVATWLLMRVSAKLFRFGLLIYGKRPGIAETLRALRAA